MRVSRIRGEVISHVRALIETSYQFNPSTSPLKVFKNQKLAKGLLNKSSFHYEFFDNDTDSRSGYCRHPIIMKIIRETWFKTQASDGITYSKYFDPIPLPCLALVFAAVSLGIEEWSTGTYRLIQFQESVVETRYRAHLTDLKVWDSIRPDATSDFRQWMYEEARNPLGVTDHGKEEPQLVGDLLDSARKELEAYTRPDFEPALGDGPDVAG